jgi:hypothetical protein
LLSIDAAGRFLNVFSDSNTTLLNGPGPRALLTYAIDQETGALTPASQAQVGSNVLPVSLVSAPAGEFLYLTFYDNIDSPLTGGILGYAQSPTGVRSPMAGSPFDPLSGDSLNQAPALDPLGRFVYAQEFNNSNTTVYAINGTTGSLTPIPGAAAPIPLGPCTIASCATVDLLTASAQSYYAITGIFLAAQSIYAWNVSATGGLTPTPGSPFKTGVLPSAAITHNWPAYSLTLSAPANAKAGVPFTISVRARDKFGNLVPGYSGTVRFSSSDARAGLPAQGGFADGSSSLSVTLLSAGTVTITVADTFLNIASASAQVQVAPGPTSQFAFSLAGPVTAGIPLSFTATAEDQYNNLTPSYSGPVQFSSSDGTAKLPSSNTLTNGLGTFSITFDTDGP